MALCKFKLNLISRKVIFSQIVRYASKKYDVIPKNLLESVFAPHCQTTCGRIYDKKPFKMRLEAGKTYAWCLCGYSRSQPICDQTHADPLMKITHRPIYFQVEETKEYWLCNCKRTKHRPFCDGSHLDPEVQAAVK